MKGEERINLSRTGLRITPNAPTSVCKKKRLSKQYPKEDVPKTAGLLSTAQIQEGKPKSVFCYEAHSSSDCLSAKKMELSEKQKMLRKRGCCFSCLKPGRAAKKIERKIMVCVLWE